jgi:hypothetical protein
VTKGSKSWIRRSDIAQLSGSFVKGKGEVGSCAVHLRKPASAHTPPTDGTTGCDLRPPHVGAVMPLLRVWFSLFAASPTRFLQTVCVLCLFSNVVLPYFVHCVHCLQRLIHVQPAMRTWVGQADVRRTRRICSDEGMVDNISVMLQHDNVSFAYESTRQYAHSDAK